MLVLFSPDGHERLTGDAWSAARTRAAIAGIVADAESAFEEGWPMHPQDVDSPVDASRRFRAVYLGGAGVVAALHRLAQRGFVELLRDYVPYLERSLDAEPDFPDEDGQRSLWMGEVGIRLVLQRLAPSSANLERLARLIAANERDERRELMCGSPGTIRGGREPGLDVRASEDWLRGQRDEDGLWTQRLHVVVGARRRPPLPELRARRARGPQLARFLGGPRSGCAPGAPDWIETVRILLAAGASLDGITLSPDDPKAPQPRGRRAPTSTRRQRRLAKPSHTSVATGGYGATSEAKIREHAARARIPAEDAFPVVETLVVRPDPVPLAA